MMMLLSHLICLTRNMKLVMMKLKIYMSPLQCLQGMNQYMQAFRQMYIEENSSDKWDIHWNVTRKLSLTTRQAYATRHLVCNAWAEGKVEYHQIYNCFSAFWLAVFFQWREIKCSQTSFDDYCTQHGIFEIEEMSHIFLLMNVFSDCDIHSSQ